MKTAFAFVTWLVVTLIEAAVFYSMWYWFVEGAFYQAPKLTFQDVLGLIIAMRLFVPDQLLQKLTRDPSGGDPLLDLALWRVKIAILLFVIGSLVHFTSPHRKSAEAGLGATSVNTGTSSVSTNTSGRPPGVTLEDIYTP